MPFALFAFFYYSNAMPYKIREEITPGTPLRLRPDLDPKQSWLERLVVVEDEKHFVFCGVEYLGKDPFVKTAGGLSIDANNLEFEDGRPILEFVVD
jgi:hypothetical protein